MLIGQNQRVFMLYSPDFSQQTDKKNNKSSMSQDSSKSDQKRTYQAVDGLRAISMCLIIIYHCFLVSHLMIGQAQFERMIREMPLALHWIWHADKSVDIFFIISGFLIAGMLFKEYKGTGTIALGNFYWRRFLRLIPMYWLALALFYPFLANNHTVWANLLYVNNFLPADESFMGWSWSLAVEEQFYFLFPLSILYIFPRFRSTAKVLIGLVVLSTLILWLMHALYPEFNDYHPSQFMFSNIEGFTIEYFSVIYDNLYTRFGALACGCWAGYMHIYHKEDVINFLKQSPIRSQCILWGAAGFIVLQTAIPYFNPDVPFSGAILVIYSVVHRNLFSIALTAILVLSIYPVTWNNPISRFLSWRIWGFIAKLTYSMYLFHLALVIGTANFLAKQFGDLSDASLAYVLFTIFVHIVIVTGMTILISCVTFFGFERPIMNLRKPAKYYA